jgi:hypothetical protein
VVTDVDLDGTGRKSLADADVVSWVSKESMGSDVIVASLCSGAGGVDRWGCAISGVGVEGPQDGQSAYI